MSSQGRMALGGVVTDPKPTLHGESARTRYARCHPERGEPDNIKSTLKRIVEAGSVEKPETPMRPEQPTKQHIFAQETKTRGCG